MPTNAIPQEYPLELQSAIDNFNRAYQERTLIYVRHCGCHAKKVRAAARAAQIPLHRLKGTAVGMGTIRQLEIANQRSDDELARCASLGQAIAKEYDPNIKQDNLPSILPEPESWVYANRLRCETRFRVGETDKHPIQRANKNSALQNIHEGEEYSWWGRTCPQLDQSERLELERFLHRTLGEKGYKREGPLDGRRGDVFSFNGRSPEQAVQDLNQLADKWFKMHEERAGGGPLYTESAAAMTSDNGRLNPSPTATPRTKPN